MTAYKRFKIVGGIALLGTLLSMNAVAADAGGGVSLSLQDALKMALEKNYDVRVQKVTLEQADMNLEASKGMYDPMLSVDWYTSVNRQPATSVLQGGLGVYLSRTDDYKLGVDQQTPWGQQFSLSWDNMRSKTNSAFFTLNPSYTSTGTLSTTLPLLKGFGTRVGNRTVLKARLDKTIAGEQYMQNLRDTLLGVETDYWNLVYAIENLKVQQQALDKARQFQEETRKKIKVGVQAPIEQVSADAQVATREENVIAARQSVGDSEDVLKLSLGIPQGSSEWNETFKPTDQPAVPQSDYNQKELIEKALKLRPELKQLQHKIEQDKLDTHWAKNQTLPQLNMTASLSYNGAAGYTMNPVTGAVVDTNFNDAWHQITGLDYKSYYIGLSFKYPIGNRSARYQYQNYRLAQNADEISLKKNELSISNEVRSALRGLQASEKRVAAAKLALKLQREKLDAEQKKYDNGLSTSFQFLSYQNDLTSAASSLLKARIDAEQAGSQLDRAVGVYLQSRGVEIK
jgi:outer membrane protein